MSGRTTAVLFVVLLVLAGYVYYQNQQEPAATPLPTPLPATPEQFSLFANATIDQVTQLEIYRAEDGITAVFSRDTQKNWVQTVPTTTQVISTTLELQTTGLINLRTTQSFAPELNPASAYGLDTPDYTISLFASREDGATVRYHLLVGNKTPTGNGYYVQREGDPRFHVVSLGVIQNMVALIDNPPIPLPTPTPLPTATITPPAAETESTATPTP